MHLLVMGHTAHYLRGGTIVGWGPTVKEINWLARVFDRVTHIACFDPGPAPKSALPYETDHVQFVGVPPAGGHTLREKARVVLCAPRYLEAICSNVPKADVIHVRCPGSLGMYGMVALPFVGKKPRWVKYAGNWIEKGRMPVSFAFQRWWLKQGLSLGPVTVNGRWDKQPSHIYAFLNPSLTVQGIQIARERSIDKQLQKPVRFVFAGRTDKAKGLGRALEIINGITRHSGDVHFDVLGNGPERPKFERMAVELGLTQKVTFRGWVPHDQIPDYLTRSHFMLLPSETEGWPKVLSEAMSYGVVPIASNVSAIPQVLAQTQAGIALSVDVIEEYVEAIADIMANSWKWKLMSLAGIEAAPLFTYERYLMALDEMFISNYSWSPLNQEVLAGIRGQVEAVGNGGFSDGR